MDKCVFCDYFIGQPESTKVLGIVPLQPVVKGHVMAVPRKHVRDVSEDPETSALTIRSAAQMAQAYDNCNVITSKGKAATQSVFHLHIHVVPRYEGDGLQLPWTNQKEQL